MWPFLTDAASVVQFVMAIGAAVMGASHILRPDIWVEFFGWLHRAGTAGLVAKIMLVELWPALLIVALHQVWSGPAILLSLYGWALLVKVAVGLLIPDLAMRSMAIPQQSPRSFIPAGIGLLAIAAASAAALVWST